MGKDYVTNGFWRFKRYGTGFQSVQTFENFTDRRQTRFDTIYTGSVTNPEFRDIYMPG